MYFAHQTFILIPPFWDVTVCCDRPFAASFTAMPFADRRFSPIVLAG